MDVALENANVSGLTLWHFFDFKGNAARTTNTTHAVAEPDGRGLGSHGHRISPDLLATLPKLLPIDLPTVLDVHAELRRYRTQVQIFFALEDPRNF